MTRTRSSERQCQVAFHGRSLRSTQGAPPVRHHCTQTMPWSPQVCIRHLVHNAHCSICLLSCTSWLSSCMMWTGTPGLDVLQCPCSNMQHACASSNGMQCCASACPSRVHVHRFRANACDLPVGQAALGSIQVAALGGDGRGSGLPHGPWHETDRTCHPPASRNPWHR